MSELVIELPAELGPCMTGYDRGAALRERLDLHQREDEVDHVRVICPASIYTISSSFFIGLLGPSVRKCGWTGAFEKKFQFVAADELQPILRGHALLALRSDLYGYR